MVDWFRHLKRKGFATAVLSNMPADILKHILSVFPWLEEFDVQVYSCSVGSVKPEAEIYEHCLQALGLPPAEILFLDDAAENTAAAEKLGFNTLTFETPEKAQTVLDRDYDLPELISR
jgi:HAD superfamily hydrolase (TIGR01509 family)